MLGSHIKIAGLEFAVASAGNRPTETELEDFRKAFPGIPPAYLDVLARSNEITGDFGERSEYVVFHSIDDATEWNRVMNVPTNEPGFTMVGGNGGGDAFFVSTTGDGSWRVLPLMDVGIKDVRLETGSNQ